MPTGYTSELYYGKAQTFEEFVLSCARAFGALITMRDDPKDAVIPAEFQPDSYHADALARARAELADVIELNEQACADRSMAEYEKAIAYNTVELSNARARRERYASMLEKVVAWKAPTTEHSGLKDFMAEQLRSSIDHDCGESYYRDNAPKFLSGAEWKEKEIQRLAHDVGYHSESHAKDVARAASRTQWIKELREAL